MKTQNTIEYKKAYFVPSWGDAIEHGMAFTISYIEYYEVKKAFFIAKGETLPKLVDAKQVVYSANEALQLLKKEQGDVRAYYEKQLKEATEKLKETPKI